MVKQNEYFPQSVSHPGATLSEKLEEMGMTVQEFSRFSGKSEETIRAIINGKRPITSEIAVQFENVTLIPAHYWINHQHGYDEYVAKSFPHTHQRRQTAIHTAVGFEV